MAHRLLRVKRWQRGLCASLARRFPPGVLLLPAAVPLRQRYHCTEVHAPGELFVFLPGIGDIMDDYEYHGFVEAVRRRGRPADALAVDAHYGYYARRTVLQRLRQDVMVPAQARGYQRVWLVGISLGGVGATLYRNASPGDLAGLVLLAPFLGSPGLIREIAGAGGVGRWQPGRVAASDYQRQLWQWLKRYTAPDASLPVLYLGYGERDAFAPGHRLLAAVLPRERIFVDAGKHDWPTWRRLWEQFLWGTADKPGHEA